MSESKRGATSHHVLLAAVCALVLIAIIWLTLRGNSGLSIQMERLPDNERVPSNFTYVMFSTSGPMDAAVLATHAEYESGELKIPTPIGDVPALLGTYAPTPPRDWREQAEGLKHLTLSAKGLRATAPIVRHVDVDRASEGDWVTLHVERGPKIFAWRYLVVNDGIAVRERGEIVKPK